MRRLVLLVLLAALALPAAAAAAGPRFALWDLQDDLAHASKNVYGDVQAKPARALSGKGTVVRCAAWCRFGTGWLAFSKPAQLSPASVASARYAYSKRKGWLVELALKPAAAVRWRTFVRKETREARQRGVPNVLVIAAGGQIAAAPFATQVTSSGATVTLPGFGRAGAKALVAALS